MRLNLLHLLPFVAVASAAVDCPEPFELIGEHCYYFSTVELPWVEARDYCKELSTEEPVDLAVFDLTPEDYRHVFLHAATQGYHTMVIGGSDIGHDGYYTWVDGRPVDISAPYWFHFDPDNSESDNAMAIESTDEVIERWRVGTLNGANPIKFICQLGINIQE